MKFEVKGNRNYCATVSEIKNIIDLEGCNNIKGTTLFGNHIIISKDVKIGDKGIYFPVESKLSDTFLKFNNLYDKPEMNSDTTKKGFFSSKGRVRAVKLKGFKSDGFWIPIESLNFLNREYKYIELYEELTYPFVDLRDGDEFDTIDGVLICEKYVVSYQNSANNKKQNEKSSKIKLSRLIHNQFRLHTDTEQLGRNIHKIKAYELMSLSQKLHGTSGISSLILCKRKLNLFEKLLRKMHVKIVDTEYSNIFSSRKVIKNDDLRKSKNDYYSVDIWSIANDELKSFLIPGMTLYFEIVGHLLDGKPIQGDYDYGCGPKEHKIFIYRATLTNCNGDVFEFSMHQLNQWCTAKGLNCVPILYYGSPYEGFTRRGYDTMCDDADWRKIFLDALTKEYLEKDCAKGIVPVWCNNKVPDEGIVLRKESLDIEAYKLKSFAFKMKESKDLDKGETNIEDNQESEQ
jgi:hypothetical protein